MLYISLILFTGVICTVKTNGIKSVSIDIYHGFGWDNLQFLDMSPIFDVSNFHDSEKFQSCNEILPVHRNKIELGSTMVDMFNAQTNDYASNLFIGGSAGYMGFKISGSYSQDYQTAKKQQGEDKTITLRNQIDYIMYDVILKSACPLNQQVKKDIIEIAGYHTSNQLSMARYAAQVFVKTYGTHFTNRLSLGGSIIQEDFIEESVYRIQTDQRRSYHAAAEASFLGTFGLSANFASSSMTSDSNFNETKKSFRRKVVNSRGGKLSLSGGSIETWQSSINSAPTIVRRAVENITFFIQSDMIPELSEVELLHVRTELYQAIETYIHMNVYSGCMDRNSSSFNWIANVDDGSCKPPEANWLFGGFIQTCTEDGRLNQQCDRYRRGNYYTNNEDCPPKFNKYLLHVSVQTENLFRREQYSCGIFGWSKCWRDVPDGIGERILTFYGCNSAQNQAKSSVGVLEISNAYVYGGSFTQKKVNPVTGTAKCPDESFEKVSVNDDLTVCLSEEVADTDSLPHYGGIYSCDEGNIALDSKTKGCPNGYSTYVMGAIEDSCLLFVCLKFESFPEVRQVPSIILPPFFTIPLRNETKIRFNTTDHNQTYTTTTTRSPPNSHNITLDLSIAGGGIGILAILVVTIFIIQSKWQRRKSDSHTGNNYEHL